MQKWQKLLPAMCLNFIRVLLLVVRVCTGKTNNKNGTKDPLPVRRQDRQGLGEKDSGSRQL